MNWRTPPRFFQKMNELFGPFTLDAAANDENHLCEKYYTEKDNGLLQPWTGRVWNNPPYGKGDGGVGEFVAKAADCAKAETFEIAVLLVTPRTDTEWWHEHALRAAEIYDVRGRIGFVDPDTLVETEGGVAPSSVLVFRPGYQGPPCRGTMDKWGNILRQAELVDDWV